jgi:hypothetical protein
MTGDKKNICITGNKFLTKKYCFQEVEGEADAPAGEAGDTTGSEAATVAASETTRPTTQAAQPKLTKDVAPQPPSTSPQLLQQQHSPQQQQQQEKQQEKPKDGI